MSDRVWSVVRLVIVFILGVFASWATWVTLSIFNAQLVDVEHTATLKALRALAEENHAVGKKLADLIR